MNLEHFETHLFAVVPTLHQYAGNTATAPEGPLQNIGLARRRLSEVPTPC